MNKGKSKSAQSQITKSSRRSDTVLLRDSFPDDELADRVDREESILDYKSDLVYFFYKEILKLVIEDYDDLPSEEERKDSDEEPTYNTEPKTESVEEEEDEKDMLARLLPSVAPNSKLKGTMLLSQSMNQIRISKYLRKVSKRTVAYWSSEGSVQPRKSTIRIDSVVQRTSIRPWGESEADESDEALEAAEEDSATRVDWFDDQRPDATKMMIRFVTGIVYRGEVREHRLHGAGTLKWPNGVVYEGDFSKGEMTGFGKIIYNDLSHYEGRFVNGVQDGFGACSVSFPNVSYSGQWAHGVPDGEGCVHYTESDCYVGAWRCGRKEGLGTRVYFDRAVYAGAWRDGRPNGEGSMVFANRDYYRGEWSEGKPHGYGEYTWSAGINRDMTFSIEKKYAGHFVNGLRDGYGVQVFGMNGSKVASQFDDNMKSGAGILVCGDGTTIERKPLFLLDNPVSGPASQLLDKCGASSHPQSSWVSLRGVNHSLRDTLIRGSGEEKSKISETFPQIERLGKPQAFPLHATAADVEIDYHVQRFLALLSAKGKGGCEQTEGAPRSSAGWRETTARNERHLLARAVANNYVYLRRVYETYATLSPLQHCCPETRNPALCRLRLWQFLRDVRVCRLRVSLVDVDLMMLDVPNIHLETEHDPFETIYFWQFMHCLLLLAFVRCQTEEPSDDLTYHEVFSGFVADVVRPLEGSFVGRALFLCKDLVPVAAVYGLYKSVGEAHSARALLDRICRPSKIPLECLVRRKRVRDLPPSHRHCVLGGSTLLYCSVEQKEPWRAKETPLPHEYDADVYSTDLKVFERLGAEKVLSCIMAVCDNIKEGEDIVFIDYQICFLEFYEILINLALELNAFKLQEEEELKKIQIGDDVLQEEDGKREKEVAVGKGAGGSGKKKNKRKHLG